MVSPPCAIRKSWVISDDKGKLTMTENLGASSSWGLEEAWFLGVSDIWARKPPPNPWGGLQHLSRASN